MSSRTGCIGNAPVAAPTRGAQSGNAWRADSPAGLEHFGDLHMRQQARTLVDERLRGFWHRSVQQRDLQTGGGDDGIG